MSSLFHRLLFFIARTHSHAPRVSLGVCVWACRCLIRILVLLPCCVAVPGKNVTLVQARCSMNCLAAQKAALPTCSFHYWPSCRSEKRCGHLIVSHHICPTQHFYLGLFRFSMRLFVLLFSHCTRRSAKRHSYTR